MMKNYGPNDARDMSKVHVLELTFQQWDYRATRTIRLGGNVAGLANNLDCALSNLYSEIADGVDGSAIIILTNDDGDTCECEDDDNRQEVWLMSLLVKAEIIGLEQKAES